MRGPGLMIGVELADPVTRAPLGNLVRRVLAAAEEDGLVLIECAAEGNVVRFIPPLVASDEELDRGLSIFERAIARAVS